MYILRDLNLTEKQDYIQNVLPYKKRGGRVESVGIQRQTGYFITGWNLVEMGPGMINDSSSPAGGSNLDPSRGYHGW